MNRFEHRYPSRVDIPASSDTHATLQHGAKIRDDVSKQIGRDDGIEGLRVLDHPHAGGVYIGVLLLDVRVFFTNQSKGTRPDVMRSDGIGLIDEHQLLLSISLSGEFERVPDDPLDTLSGVDHLLHRHFVQGSLLEDSTDPCIGILGVFSNHDEVDVIGSLVLERAELL